MKLKELSLLFLLPGIFISAGDKEEACHSFYRKSHLGVRHQEGRGVGYKKGYTTLEGFFSFDNQSVVMPFIDVRGHLFNDKKWAGNVGIGERTFFPSINHMFSSYLYYDFRRECEGWTINRLSPGIELMGSRMEYRLNGYISLGRKRGHTHLPKFHRFENHHIIIKARQKQAMTGFDGEVGGHFVERKDNDVYLGAGPYYFASKNATAWGGKGRISYRWRDVVLVQASASYDHLFHFAAQGEVGFYISFGKKLKRKNCQEQTSFVLTRANFAPYRMEIPVVKNAKIKKKAINPLTGEAWFVWFVDNTSSSLGTFESPFPTLLQAQNASNPFDMIYIFPGDGTSTGMDVGITLQDGQFLLGAGTSQRIPISHGKITIPPLANSFPLLTNPTDVVTLAHQNRVVGLNLLVPNASTGISSIDIANVPNNFFVIKKNLIMSDLDHTGIRIMVGGKITIKQNKLVSTAGSPIANGIFVIPISGFLEADISQNSISGYNTSIFCQTISPLSRTTISITENLCTGFVSNGIHFDNFASSNPLMTIATNNIVITQTAATGITITNITPVIGSVSLAENLITIPAVTGGTGISLDSSSLFQSLIQLSIVDNRVVFGTSAGGAGATGISATTINSNVWCASISDNLISGITTGVGFNLSAGPSPTAVINLRAFDHNVADNNIFSGNVIVGQPCGF